MLALFRPLWWCFMPWLYSHGFIPWLYSGLYTGFHVAGAPGRPLRAESVGAGCPLFCWFCDFWIFFWQCCSGCLWRIESVGPSTPGELNPLAPGDSIAVFGLVLSYSKLHICFILKNLRPIPSPVAIHASLPLRVLWRAASPLQRVG